MAKMAYQRHQRNIGSVWRISWLMPARLAAYQLAAGESSAMAA